MERIEHLIIDSKGYTLKVGDKVFVCYYGTFGGSNALGEPIVQYEEGEGHFRGSTVPKDMLTKVTF